ncbi:hypothetical protein GW755_01490 [bacterium]|nr:hypothetical protein [bacterium]
MEISKIRELGISELYKELGKVRKTQQASVLRLKSGKISELKNKRLSRGVIARIKTVILEKSKINHEKA